MTLLPMHTVIHAHHGTMLMKVKDHMVAQVAMMMMTSQLLLSVVHVVVDLPVVIHQVMMILLRCLKMRELN